jgi:Protein of unknown function (DUF2809)
MIKLNLPYLYWTGLLFLTELCIAIFFDDRIIRPLVGDVLAIALVYCFIKAFWRVRPGCAIAAAFAFACALEGLQYLRLVDRLGLRAYPPLAIAIGTTFDWRDIAAYALGAGLVLLVERRRGLA